MTYWDDFDQSDDQKHWSAWTMRRPKRNLALKNYLSAFVFTLSAFVVVAGNTI